MVRRIVSVAALAALVVSLSACQCGKTAKGSAPAKAGGSTAAAAPAAASGSSAASPAASGASSSSDASAPAKPRVADIYRSEEDRPMNRMDDAPKPKK